MEVLNVEQQRGIQIHVNVVELPQAVQSLETLGICYQGGKTKEMDDMTMKLSLIELYDLIGDDKGISFLYEDLPGVVVTIGFNRDGSEDEELINEEEETENGKPTKH